MRTIRFACFLTLAPVLLALPLGACAGDPFTAAEPSAPGLDGSSDVSTPDAAGGNESGAVGEDAAADSGGGPIVPPGCEKTPKEDGAVVRDGCGVFVVPTGDDVAAGTKAAPVRTLARGIALAKSEGKRVFACAARYDEKLVLDASTDGVALHGGFLCPSTPLDSDAGADAGIDGGASAWTYVAGARARVAPASPGIALTLNGLTIGALVEDMTFQAADAVTAGESSVAVVVAQARGVVFRRVGITAGNGATGAAGATVTGGAAEPVPVPNGTKDGNNATAATGAGERKCTCGAEETVGGKGGDNVPTTGGDGAPGQANRNIAPYPASPAAQDTGEGGSGETSASCTNGRRGAQPPARASGGGAAQATWTLTSTGVSAEGTGSAGSPGVIGQGGGGGGGYNAALLGIGAAGGGSGGCGGCGGAGGLGGKAGGSSIALASIGSSVVVGEGTELIAGNGGDGGRGGAGQIGSEGGNGGAPKTNACGGGRGARGGAGGSGGGGAGGASIALAFNGTPPDTTGSVLATGTAGIGGNDGSDTPTPAGKGAPGIARMAHALP